MKIYLPYWFFQVPLLTVIIRIGNPSSPSDNLDYNGDVSNYRINQNKIIESNDKFAERSYTSIADDIINFDLTGSDIHVPSSDVQESGKQLYKCEECDNSYKSKMSLGLHKMIKHEDIRYSCKTQTKCYLKIHEECVHEGMNYTNYYNKYHPYNCDRCDAKFKGHSGLSQHIDDK